MFILKFILSNLNKYQKRFWLSVFAGLVASFSSLAIPLFLTEFTKSGLSQNDLLRLIAWLVTAILVSLGSSWVIRKYGEALSKQFPNHLQLKYFRELEQLPINQLAKSHTGYVLSMVNQIGERMQRIIFDIFWTFTGIVANIGFLVYFTATKSWGLTVLNLLLFLAFVIISTLLARKMTQLANDMNRRHAVYSQYFVDFMSNLVTVKRLGIKTFAEDRLIRRSDDSNRQIQEFQNAHANRWLLLHGTYYTANFVTIGYLLYEISKGNLPVSILILFLAFYGNIRGIIERVAENIITFTEARVYINNLNALLETDSVNHNTKQPHGEWRHIKLHDIVYRHADNDALIRIPELTIDEGDKVCLYGSSGEGKTTVLNLIANYLRAERGHRTVDDTSYENLNARWFAEHTAFISQETELFNISLKDNLVLGQKIKDDRLWQLLADLDLAGWVQGLDKGLDTMVGEKGLRLSAGQKQRINLARGILLDRSLYLLDEPTSHLDATTEKSTIKVIEKYLADKTVVIVTHRPAIKKTCNKFYQMSDHVVSPE